MPPQLGRVLKACCSLARRALSSQPGPKCWSQPSTVSFLSRPQSPVPHPCDFFLSQGWETTNLNPALFIGSTLTRDASYISNERRAGSATKAPCPVLAPFFWRKGGKAQISTRSVHRERSAAESKNLLLASRSQGWETSTLFKGRINRIDKARYRFFSFRLWLSEAFSVIP